MCKEEAAQGSLANLCSWLPSDRTMYLISVCPFWPYVINVTFPHVYRTTHVLSLVIHKTIKLSTVFKVKLKLKGVKCHAGVLIT